MQTLNQLKAFCHSHSITVTGDKRRKQSYIDAIDAYNASLECDHDHTDRIMEQGNMQPLPLTTEPAIDSDPWQQPVTTRIANAPMATSSYQLCLPPAPATDVAPSPAIILLAAFILPLLLITLVCEGIRAGLNSSLGQTIISQFKRLTGAFKRGTKHQPSTTMDQIVALYN